MTNYFEELIQLFEQHSNKKEAALMEKYMRNKFHFFGIKKPLREELIKKHLKVQRQPDINELVSIVDQYWNYPAREVQYTLQGFLSNQKKKFHKSHIELFEFMILNGSWWDTVDYIAGDLVGSYFLSYPQEIDFWTSKWMNSGNFWLQRSCILYQLKYKEKTDHERLKGYILPCANSNEFFLQKAIGWALRQYSKTNQEWVKIFINQNDLKPLSVREGLKWIHKQEKK